MNADRTEADLAQRAIKERWTFDEFLHELRRQRSDMSPAPLPPEPTDELPGTLEKINVLCRRIEDGFAACHYADPRFENGLLIITGTVTDNGGDAEREAQDEASWRRERQKNKADCDPAMTARLDRIGQMLARLRTRRGRSG